MGIARAWYGKKSDRIPLRKMMLLCGVLCVACYLVAAFAPIPVLGLAGCAVCGFSVGIFWPGTFSVAARQLPGGGTAMYALLFRTDRSGNDGECVRGQSESGAGTGNGLSHSDHSRDQQTAGQDHGDLILAYRFG